MHGATIRRRAAALAATMTVAFLTVVTSFTSIAQAPEPVHARGVVAERDDAPVFSRGERAPQTPPGQPTSTPGTATPGDAAPASSPAVPSPATSVATPKPAVATPVPTPAPTPVPLSAIKLRAPASQLRVGIQSGHWKPEEAPEVLASFRKSVGAQEGDWREADVNLEVSRRVVALLKGLGLRVDLLPVTVPVQYRSDAFLAIHGDANVDPKLSGFKVARATWSKIPERDDALVNSIIAEYRAGTGLSENRETITENMRQYYAFNYRVPYSTDRSTPAAILEMGFLTNGGDRKLLKDQPDRIAESIARGILKYLGAP